jgi:hypothetical protein
MSSNKVIVLDAKPQRMFINNVVVHLQKALREYDGKDPEGLLKTMDDATNMIKFVLKGKKKTQQKRGKKKKTDKAAEPSTPPVVSST